MTTNNDSSVTNSSSSTGINKTDEVYENSVTDAVPILKPLDEPELDVYNIETYCSDDYTVDVAWSPSGLSHSRGCILTALTNQGDIHLFELESDTQTFKYIRIESLILFLRKKYGTTDTQLLPRGSGIEDYLFQAISWSSRVPSPSPILNKWGTAFLAAATKSGKINLFEPYHDPVEAQDTTIQKQTKFRLLSTIPVFQSEFSHEDNWITLLKWFPWVQLSDSESRYLSYIVYVTSSNRVIVKPIIFDITTQQFDTSIPVKFLQGPSRFLISSLSVHFHKKSETFFVAICQMNGVSLFAFDKKFIHKKSQLENGTAASDSILKAEANESSDPTLHKFFVEADPEKEPVEKVCVFNSNESQVWVAGVANTLNTFLGLATISQNNETFDIQFTDVSTSQPSQDDPNKPEALANNVLQAFVDRRTNLINNETNASSGIISDSNSVYHIQCFGLASHPTSGDYLALLCRKISEKELRYLLPSHERYQICFIPFVYENGQHATVKKEYVLRETRVESVQKKTNPDNSDESSDNNDSENEAKEASEPATEADFKQSITREVTIPNPDALIRSIPSALECSSELTWWRVKALSNSVKKAKGRPVFVKTLIIELEQYIKVNYKEAMCISSSFDFSESGSVSEDDNDIMMAEPSHSATSVSLSLVSALTSKFFSTRFYDALRLLIHTKALALQMQETGKQARDREYQTFTDMDDSHGISAPTRPAFLFGEDIKRYETEIEQHLQFIFNEFAFMVLVYVSQILQKKKNANQDDELHISNVERAIVSSFIVQLQKELSNNEDIWVIGSKSLPNSRLDTKFLTYLLETCQNLITKSATKQQQSDSNVDSENDTKMTDADEVTQPSDSQIVLEGEGFSETFDFATATSRDELVSERGYPWRRCAITLLPLTYYDTKTCMGCKRQTALLSSYSNSNETSDKTSSFNLLTTLLNPNTFDVCLYCGCRYTQSS